MTGRDPSDRRRRRGPVVRVDWPSCRAHGLCAELLPERIGLDPWGYPLVDSGPVPRAQLKDARRAVVACPTMALHLLDDAAVRPEDRTTPRDAAV